MDIRQLNYFITIAEEGTITQAAKVLHIAQPHLSRQLKEMELELGLQLFDRNKKKAVSLTAQGRLFLEKAKEVINRFNDAIVEVKELGEEISGTLAIGTTIYCAPIMLARLEKFRQDHPQVRFHIWEGPSSYLKDLLGNRQIDLAVSASSLAKADLQEKVITDIPCQLLAPKKMPVPRNQVDLHYLSTIPIIILRSSLGNGLYGRITAEFESRGLQPNIICECHDSAILLDLVKMGVGAAILPNSMLHDLSMQNCEVYNIVDNPWTIRATVVWRANSYLPKTAKEFIDSF
ncbi:LysR family transcriptional regulator [Pullulanibacillus sp. KACC 23026]|uniref:LysR family transcriptional regulator n=1 Tax=Pullulanibacillus sp. KACC 23026 TaxID=3028315 RepID=UPI0023B11243|nr:LysR family transcriptional regulator [Pullulanibacillus sp. KACC 23026]WEG12411.1 LysR family transcriptional regulator [Pullulanibacillus sp. KACC 23026]